MTFPIAAFKYRITFLVMKTLPMALGILAALLVSGCSSQTSQSQGNSAAIANPASVKCEQNGGLVKLLYGPDGGQYGLCLFNDGSVCEEWALFNGSCNKGLCMRACQFIGSRSEGWYDCHGSLLFWDNCANETAATAGTC